MRKFWLALEIVMYVLTIPFVLFLVFRRNLSTEQVTTQLASIVSLIVFGIFFHGMYYLRKILDNQQATTADDELTHHNQVAISAILDERLPDMRNTDDQQNWYGSLFLIIQRTFNQDGTFVDRIVFDDHRRKLVETYPQGKPHPYVDAGNVQYIFWNIDAFDMPTGREITWSVASFPQPVNTVSEQQFQQTLAGIR